MMKGPLEFRIRNEPLGKEIKFKMNNTWREILFPNKK
jgi:hypothetical protein